MSENKISIKLAKEISIEKWEGELNQSNYESKLLEKYPNLNLLQYYYCGFCVRHNYAWSRDNLSCVNCEIAKANLPCSTNGSLFDQIIDGQDMGEDVDDLIEELIEIIKNIPEDEE